MVFVGDIAVPNGGKTNLNYLPECFKSGTIANLEGCIIEDKVKGSLSLYNTQDALHIMKKMNVCCVSLANNHVLDEQDSFLYTKRALEENGILYAGAGVTKEEAESFKTIEIEGEKYYFLTYAWNITGVSNKKKNKVQISILNRKKILRQIKEIREEDSCSKIICWMHWGCELELYPLPMDREFAHELIDVGAWAVVGCHTHCIQGAEIYKNRPIIYGLGNFYCPEDIFLGGELCYPEFAHEELAFEVSKDGYKCHWFYYDKEKDCIEYKGETSIDSVELLQKTPYSGMDNKEYSKWFKKNRRKKKGIPVFYSYKNIISYAIKNKWMQVRGGIIRFLFKTGIKGGPV